MRDDAPLPPIAHETTRATGLLHTDGQGFATFGKVVRGMDVVRAIGLLRDPVAGDQAFMPGQKLARPVAITAVRRAP